MQISDDRKNEWTTHSRLAKNKFVGFRVVLKSLQYVSIWHSKFHMVCLYTDSIQNGFQSLVRPLPRNLNHEYKTAAGRRGCRLRSLRDRHSHRHDLPRAPGAGSARGGRVRYGPAPAPATHFVWTRWEAGERHMKGGLPDTFGAKSVFQTLTVA